MKRHSIMVDNSQEYRLKYWATRSSVRSFARTAHSIACSGLLASLASSAALTPSLARSLRSLPRSWDSELFMSQNDLVLSHSGSADRVSCQLIEYSPTSFVSATHIVLVTRFSVRPDTCKVCPPVQNFTSIRFKRPMTDPLIKRRF